MILGLSGKKQSGKDTVAKIIQYLIHCKLYNSNVSYDDWIRYDSKHSESTWKIVKFADKIKDIVCLIIGCTREQLENEEFKNTPLGIEWRNYSYSIAEGKTEFDEGEPSVINQYRLTPRMLLQQLGTDVCRAIHPNTWINATMRDYKFKSYSIGIDKYGHQTIVDKYPNWIITDVRFPNEYDAIKERNGIVIRVNMNPSNKWIDKAEWDFNKHGIESHPSETSLDNYEFDHVISNNGTIDDLIVKVKDILIKEKLI